MGNAVVGCLSGEAGCSCLFPQERLATGGAAEAEGWAVLLQECREHIHSKTTVPCSRAEHETPLLCPMRLLCEENLGCASWALGATRTLCG